jgi:hypothetical protein
MTGGRLDANGASCLRTRKPYYLEIDELFHPGH